jgi:hypothetical protein
MDKFPKMETIEATLFGQRMDIGPSDKEIAEALYQSSPEFKRVADAAASAFHIANQIAPVSGVGMAHVVAYALRAGVTAERARAECEQLTLAMIPEKGERPCHREDSCDSIT